MTDVATGPRAGSAPVLDVAGLVDDVVAPAAARFDREQAIPRQFLDDVVASRRLWGALVAEKFGGLGMSTTEFGALHEEVGRGCSSLRSLLTVQAMVAYAIERFGTSEQQERWLPGLAGGQLLASFCLSEPAAGSDTRAISMSATEVADGWCLRGRKKWITGGQIADLFLVFAQTPTGVSSFVVPRGAGVTTVPIHDVLGTRASMLAEVDLDDVLVPEDAQIGPRSFAPGFVLNAALDIGRFSVACGSTGIVRACLRASLEFTKQRTVGGEPLAELQMTKSKVADMTTALAASRALWRAAAACRDSRDPAFTRAACIAKYFASRAAATAASAAVQIHGALGCTDDQPVARYYRDAKIMEIIEGSHEIQQLVIAGFASQEESRS